MNFKARSFFDRLTGSVPMDESEESYDMGTKLASAKSRGEESVLEQEEEAQLTVDVYQTTEEIVIQAMVAGVRPEELDVSITQDMVTLSGKRSRIQHVSDENFYYHELYWGSFSRSILLPQEVDAEEAQATMKNGLLTIHLPKLDKSRIQKVKIKQE